MAGLDLVGPYLTKVAIDRHIARGDAAGLTPGGRASTSSPCWPASRVRFAQVYILQMTGQRIMLDLRRADLRPPAAPARRLLRPQPGGPAHDPGHHRRGRGQRAVHLRRGDGVRRPLHAARHHGRDAGPELAAGPGHLRGDPPVLPGHELVPRAARASSFREVRKWVARINAFLQENLTRDVGGPALPPGGAQPGRLRRHQPRPRRRQPAPDLLLRGLLPGHRAAGRGGHRAHPSLRRRRRARGRRSPWARWWPSSSTPSGSGGPSPTSRRSSTSCRRPWPPRSGSSRCSTRRPEVQAPARPVRAARGRRAGWPSRACRSPTSPGRVGPAGRRLRGGARPERGPGGRAPARARPRSSACSPASTTCRRGRVTLDGVDVRDLDPAQLRSSLALVLQDVHLFSGTIASNIRLGSDIPDERCGRRPARCTRTASSRPCPGATTRR